MAEKEMVASLRTTDAKEEKMVAQTASKGVEGGRSGPKIRAEDPGGRSELVMSDLRDYYKQKVEENVGFNNWNMGCSDLRLLGPYFRAIMDRLPKKPHRLLFDVGANNGQDAEEIMGLFQEHMGLCKSWSPDVTVVSIEPSPQVFCELEELAAKNGWEASEKGKIIRMNVGMSEETGFLRFQDPGNEGGQLLDSVKSSGNQTLGPTMTPEELRTMTQCKHSSNRTLDHERITIVPTYTMDVLITALEEAHPMVKKGSEIFFLKIDTEGHDKFVMMGARNLLEQKRIVFVLFEVWTNERIREIASFMDELDYACFIISPKVLLPIHPENWWYDHLDEELHWWGNGV
eukprot:CAMPEP_0195305438 /NCGR_PEP_ID=MMETSP0707-20130614/36260_1 /TAXON_ID=33640 /ORGANISM="Asterionellopsis glacialis, Strain CCMP134" /LENGTH=344 /DNA_ID=CAMNT_0040369559 /DNA_START=189 /DNA_END=1223 /DNA_ORIENTATION=-